MKKILSVMLALALVLSSFVFTCVTAAAAGGDITDGLTWCFDENTGLLTISGAGDMPDYDNLGEFAMPWGEYAFSAKSLVIGEGVTRIGVGSFALFTELENVSFPSTLKSIGEYAFAYCGKIESITLDGIEEIGSYAFMGCSCEACANDLGLEMPEERTGLNTLTITGEDYIISDLAFACCFELDTVTLDGVKEIGETAFAYCSNVGFAMYNDAPLPEQKSGLKHLIISGNSVNIGYGAFIFCMEMTDVFLEGIDVIGDNSFSYCANLGSLEIDDVTKIGEGAFSGCCAAFVNGAFGEEVYPENAGLKEVIIHGNAAELSDGAFAQCLLLSDVIFDDVVYAGSGVFEDTALIADENNYRNGCFYVDGMLFEISDEEISSPYIIAPGTKGIIGGSFEDMSGLDVYFPAEVETICSSAFGANNVRFFGEEGSAAESYAELNGIPFKTAYVASDDLTLNYDEKVIFFDDAEESSVLYDLYTITNDKYSMNINASSDYCRTGDTVTVKDGDTVKAVYTVAVKNDLNGDFVCDVLDIALAETLMSGARDADGAQILAAKGSADYLDSYEVTAADYQALVNTALA